MTDKLFIPILLGSVRQGRESEKVARLILARIQSEYPQIETVLFDPRLMNVPHSEEGTALAAINRDWQEAILRADALIVIAPEYNHGYPGSLKDVLDMLLREYIHKAVGLVGVSSGWTGGTRVIESLLPVVRELGLAVTFTDLNVSYVQKAFADDGTAIDPKLNTRTDSFLNELVWLSTTLRWGRANLK